MEVHFVVYFTPIWYSWGFYGPWYIFFSFWCDVSRKIWQPCSTALDRHKTNFYGI
jgi:hypothetical protein